MLAKLGDKVKRKIKRGVDKIRRPPSANRTPGPSSSVSITDSGATNTPIPYATPQVPASDPNALAPPGSSTQIEPTSAPQPVVASSAQPSTDTLPPTSRTNDSNSPTVQDPAPIQATSSASAATPGTERSVKSTAWSGLKTLLGLLNEGAPAFGPLKSAFDGVSRCIEIYERAAKGREDYEKLRDELDSLFWRIFSYVNGPAPPVMTSSLVNLAKGIEMEIGFVLGKEKRNKIERAAEAMEDADEIIECYQRIQRLLERFSLNANVNIWKTVDEQATENRLKGLSPSLAAQYGSAESTDLRRNGCIPNTRIDLLNQLKTWAEDGESKRIYWLNGMAGTGKTTIAYSLCEQLESSMTLAASFFCSRQLPACRSVSLIIPTIAYQLARFSFPFRHALSSALEQAPDVHTLKVSKQFRKLILEPLQAVRHTIPPGLVVAIDALDECDSKDGVDQILETLLLHAPGLPIKFFVTSRPEARILDQMTSEQGRGVPVKLDLHNLEHSVVREDIQTYLKVKLERAQLSDADLERLVDQSGVLFIYAATVVRYIGADNFSRSPKRLAQVLAASSPLHTHSSVEIDALYEDILKAALDDKTLDDSDRKEMKDVLHTVIGAQEPLTVSIIASLLKLDVHSVQAGLRPLSSVLHLSSESNGVVTTFHESFPDYMQDKHRSGTLFCDSRSNNAQLAQRCFDLIGAHNPPFNICDLESSYVFDKDVPDLERRVKTAISDEMFYACQYWGPHLVLAEASSELLDALQAFLSVRLLLWMEVMNLKQCMYAGVGRLHQVQVCSQISSSSDDVKEITLDAWRFTMAFSTSPMSRSTPHIYVSALPFWPSQRPISRCYLSKMQGLASVTGGAMRKRERAPLAVCTTASVVTCVAYSHDGTRIVSGSDDRTLRIWDAHTGQMVGEPLEGHTSAVSSVAYSHDGTRIVSGSYDKTLRIWDAHTGQMVGEPLEGHTSEVCSVAYSHDGTRIVSGSSDDTLRIWDAHTCQMVGEPLEGHTRRVCSVAYSHNGTRIVSGSSDNTLRIWDARLDQNADHSTSEMSSQMLNLPTSSHTTTNPHATWEMDKHGWVLVDRSKLLMWVPDEVWSSLLRTQNLHVISRSGSLALDFSKAKLGDRWRECYCPKNMSSL